MADKNKVYGLIVPKKKQEQTKVKSAQTAFNVFGNESDEEEKPGAPVNHFRQGAAPCKVKSQVQIEIDSALQQDPNVYEYDAIYDEIQANKPQVGLKEKEKSEQDKKPRYIVGLLKAAEQKKKEDERRQERKVQKEREAEGEKYADKEKFVTSAYKQKMLAMQEEEERERREAAFEAMTDVTKQKDMSGFYRYLYRQTAGNEVTSGNNESVKVKEEVTEGPKHKIDQDSSSSTRRPKQSPSTSSSESSPKRDGTTDKVTERTAQKAGMSRPAKNSNYRKPRADTSSSSDSEDSTERDKSKTSSRIHRQHSRSISPHRTSSKREHKLSQDYKKRGSQSLSPVMKGRKTSRSRSRSPHRTSSKREHKLSSDYKKRRSKSPIKKRKRSSSREQFGENLSGRSKESSRSKHGSRSRENSRRSRSKDKYKKDESSKSKNDIERSPVSKPQSSGRKRRNSSRSSSSEVSNEERLEVKDRDKDLERSRTTKNSVKEKKDHAKEKSNKAEENEAAPSSNEDAKKLTEQAITDGRGSVVEGPAKPKPIDPAKKVYLHHNSPEDIEAARKRYLQRKLARARAC